MSLRLLINVVINELCYHVGDDSPQIRLLYQSVLISPGLQIMTEECNIIQGINNKPYLNCKQAGIYEGLESPT